MTTPDGDSIAHAKPSEAKRFRTALDHNAGALARVYVDALLNVTRDSGDTDAVLEELEQLVAFYDEQSPKVRDILFSPLIKPEAKEAMLAKILDAAGASEKLKRFLLVVNRRERLNLLPLIARQARESWDRSQGRLLFTVTSAVPLTDEQLERVRRTCETLLRDRTNLTRTRIETVVDPSILGGLIIRAGDTLFDASVRKKLQTIQHRLTEQRNHEIQNRRDHFTHSA